MSRPRKYPFHELAPGEEALWPWPEPRPGIGSWRAKQEAADQLKRAAGSAWMYARQRGWRISVHKTPAGIRFVRHATEAQS